MTAVLTIATEPKVFTLLLAELLPCSDVPLRMTIG
jgi:hypothetical protein